MDSAPLTVRIEAVTAADVEGICGLAAVIWHRHYPGIISVAQIEYMLRQRYDPQLLRAELDRGNVWWDKLLLGDEVIGFSSYFPDERPGEMKLDKLYVLQNQQRKGYGGMLLARSCATARAHGCTALTLAVNRNNGQAIAAYRKYGFRVRAAVVKDIGNGFVMDDYLMEKPLVDAR